MQSSYPILIIHWWLIDISFRKCEDWQENPYNLSGQGQLAGGTSSTLEKILLNVLTLSFTEPEGKGQFLQHWGPAQLRPNAKTFQPELRPY